MGKRARQKRREGRLKRKWRATLIDPPMDICDWCQRNKANQRVTLCRGVYAYLCSRCFTSFAQTKHARGLRFAWWR